MIRVDIKDLRKLNNINELAKIFSHRLNYEYVDTPISTRLWKEGIVKSIVDKEIKLLAKHKDFYIIHCKLIELLLGLERPIINQLLKEYPYLLVIFSDSNLKNWHFVNIKYDDEVKNRRLFRRIVIGPDERLHTAAQRINMLEVTDEMISPLELQIKHDKAFDVEEVTKDFYMKYTEIFHMLSKDIAEENPQQDTYKESQIILDRLIFLYFIQKKGWLNNNKRYLYENFLKFWKRDPNSTNFYSDFLIKLFRDLSFQGSLYKESLGNVPFLNGGLFEVDPSHSKLPFHIVIKNNTFKQIFDDLLEHFNFTVREDTPLDIEVAIDPEMLGKIFENLILRLEKGEDLRKKTGSYYTPRVIVHFMCQQSLKEYLVNESEIDRSKIESLFTMSPADQLSEQELKKLESLISMPQARLLKSLIKKINIIDPAVGSGAFLVSMLHEMLYIIKLLDIREFDKEYILRINYDYELKRQLIETCLYGVDIQEQAVRICELRLWLSLIVDYEKIESEDVPSLPNLSYRIRCGDSLIEKLFGHCVQLDQLVKTDKGRQLIDEISRDKEAYFLARDIKEKNRIELSTLVKQCELMESLIKEKQKSLAGPQLSFLKETSKERKKREEFEETKKEYEYLLLLATNTRKKVEAMLKGKIPFIAEDIPDLKKKLGISFIWKLDFAEVFKEKGGFDVVIANPPYVRQEKIKDQKQSLQKQGYEVYNSTSDLYTYFYERSHHILKPNGFSCFISSNKWMRAKYGEKLRRFFKEKTTLKQIIDFNGYQVFDATVDTDILLFQKTKPSENIVNILNIQPDFTPSTDITNYFNSHKLEMKQSDFDSNCFTFGDEAILNLKKKIEKRGTPLKNWDVKIYRGITTGLNKVFIVDEKTKNELIKRDKKSLEILKPILRGKDVNKWFYEFKGFCLIYTYTGIDIKKYQAIYEYLKQYKSELEQVWEAKYGKKNWYELRGCGYYSEFEKEKIVWADINIENSFSFDNKNIFVSNTGYILTGKNLKYLLAVINSLIQNFYFKQISQNLGEKGYRYIYEFVEQLPIPKISESDQKPFINLVDKILAITKYSDYLENHNKKAKVKEYERQVDQMVYKLYDLIEEEIKIIEGNSK